MKALLENGVRIPEQISIIGYDDITFAPSAAIPLTSIAQPAYQLGVASAELIISECEDGDAHAHQQIRFQPKLIVRASTNRRA
jgi:LacI family transcriptional regulator